MGLREFRMLGVVGLGAILSGAAWVLTSLPRGLDASLVAIGIAVVAVAIVFVRYESGLADPALPPALFKIRPFTAANGAK